MALKFQTLVDFLPIMILFVLMMITLTLSSQTVIFIYMIFSLLTRQDVTLSNILIMSLLEFNQRVSRKGQSLLLNYLSIVRLG